ncbi:MAG TPA: hypothetical protein VHA57_00645, partial [Actinomycetota bacterium]|nr:hypothetical protein [Actinomycetota bacterium]
EPPAGEQPENDPGPGPASASGAQPASASGAQPGSGWGAQWTGPVWPAPSSPSGASPATPPAGQPTGQWGAGAGPSWPPQPGQPTAGQPGQPPAGQPGQPPAGQAPAGWYPDPWYSGQRRYWDGRSWTGHAFPEVTSPAGAAGHPVGSAPSSAPPAAGGKPGTQAPPPPEWRPPTTWGEPPPLPIPAPPPHQKKPFWTWPPKGRALVAILIILAFLGGGIAGLIASYHKPSNPNASGPGSPNSQDVTPTPTSTDPSAPVLSGLVLQQSDVTATETVTPAPGGNGLGVATLDLCNGNYPSDSLRTARLQVDGTDANNNVLISTEAVLYKAAADTTQAFSELASNATNCPSGPVVSPVGEATIQTTFGPTPDGSWPQVAGVTRQAYAFNTVDESGDVQPATAVYLRRGRALLGVYFYTPANQPQLPVDDQTSMAAIVNIFATRLAQVPASRIGA